MTRTEQLLLLQERAEALATPLARESLDHGPRHWRDVARIGLALCDTTSELPYSERFAVFTFAVLHDTQRESEFGDPHHGKRAATALAELDPYVRPLLGKENRNDPNDIYKRLTHALIHHDKGGRTMEPLGAICYDADRLTIGRVGIRPSLEYMSTAIVRGALDGWINIALTTMNEVHPPSWEDNARGYANED